MKIAVVCANGKAGKLIVREALSRGADVTAVVRGDNKSEAKKVIKKDLFDLTTDDLKDFDVVVDAFGAWTEDTIPFIGKAIKHLADILSGSDIRLLVVGGAGSLFVDKAHTITVDQGADFPDEWKPLSASHGEGLKYLRNSKDLKWTYISPAGDFRADGERTGKYILGGEELTLNSKGESVISYADYAIALVDEALNGNNIQKRVSVVSE